ncbi:glycoside-pentoside-hexuronide (GPH):cation symporter [Novosphingobium resinovorum]|uniref:MFS transporter n=1 Tax=Novosphingobium resinovorum TaxID=158500 RepID=UPI002ED07DAB|nr:glycoside-pentoside-hexuronide (GPH):cation symporter [Novosphingobium resinovorum]
MTAEATAATIPAAPAPLSLGRKLSLAVGDFGMNLYWQSITYFLLYFYTDVVGLSVGVAGTIYMAASIFDGCIDPLFGALIERTNTRWGKYRPWLVAGAAPLALSFMLIYWSPSASGTVLVVVVTAAHLMFRMCYTSVAVPMASLVARVTRDSGERASLTGYRMLFAAAGSMTVALGTRPLTAMLGSTEAIGFLWVAVLSGILASAIFLFVAARVIEPQESAAQVGMPAPSAAQRWRATFANRAFCTLVVGLLGAQLAITVISKSLIYYFKYVVKDVDASSPALTIVTSSAFVLVPFWSWLARRRGKREVWLTGAGIAFATLCLFLAVRPTGATAATAFYIVMQIAVVAMIVSYWSLLPDTVEFGELASGWRMEAFLVGLFMFFQKMGLGLAAGALGWALSLAGVENMETGAAKMAAMLPIVIAVLAGAGVALSGIATYLSPMKRGVHEDICDQLAARERAAG